MTRTENDVDVSHDVGAPTDGSIPRREPTAARDVELSALHQHLRLGASERPWAFARLLVRAHGVPLGEVTVPVEGGLVRLDVIATAVLRDLGAQLVAHRVADGLAASASGSTLLPAVDAPECSWRARWDGPLPTASVVVTTVGDRPELAQVLASLHRQTMAPHEVLVVDNSPEGSSAVRSLVEALPEKPPVRYVHQPRRGLSNARNAGLLAATGSAIAFTDDDVVVDQDWLAWLVTSLHQNESVVAASGLILPTDLESDAQLFFEEFGGYSKGFQPHVMDATPDPTDPLHPYRLGRYGSGASNVFEAHVLRDLGGFDSRLGAGTPTAGGEDLDIFLRVVLAGHAVSYEPRAVIRHPNHREQRALERQMHGYGRGLGAAVAKHLVEGSWSQRRAMAARGVAGVRHLLSPTSLKNQRKGTSYPLRLTLLELAGLVRGAVDFVRTRKRT